jgi:outer membrane lipoprotein-sorting protein
MKRTLSTLLMLIVIVGLLLSACTVAPEKELTPQEIMTKAVEATKNLKSASMDYTINMVVVATTMKFTGTGVVKNPDQAYVKMSFGGQPFEMLMVAKNKLYVRTDPNGSWAPMKSSTTTQVGMNPNLFSQQLQLVAQFQDPNLVGSEKVNDVDCWHISYTMDLVKAMTVLAGSTMSTIDNGKANGDVWIGKRDFVVYKSELKTKYVFNKMASDLDLVMTMKDINKSVNIPTP